MQDKEKLYTIKNVKNENLLLTYHITDKKFLLLDNNTPIINTSFINYFMLEFINTDHYMLIFIRNKKKYKINVKLVFSSNKIDNVLLFNIYIKNPNNSYTLLKTNCKNIICKSHYLLNINTNENKNENKFKKDKTYVFYLNYLNLQPCRIRLNKQLFNVYGYTKTPNIKNINNNTQNTDNNTQNTNNIKNTENYNITCNVNRDLDNSWKVKFNNNCKYIHFKDNQYNEKLQKCSTNNKSSFLLNKLPNLVKIFKDLVNKNKTIKAGDQQKKIDDAKKIIDSKVGNESTRNAVNKLEKTLPPEYREVLAESLDNFSKLDKDSLTKDNYIELLQDLYEKKKEYKLIGKYKMCEGVKLTNVCNVENVVQCQKKCNEIYDCAHLSYDNRKKVCKIYNTCNKLKDSFDHSSYSKMSLLRNNGYNIYNSILIHKNMPIQEIPTFIRLMTFVCGVIIIVSLSMIIFKIIKSFIKLFLCMYYDTCYSPTELLNLFSNEGPSKKYI